MKQFFAVLSAFLIAPTLVHSIVPPGASTPEFYLVASSENPSANLLPLRTEGGANGYATLTGTGAIGQFYFFQGVLTGVPRPSRTSTLRPDIGAILGPTSCSTYGPLGFTESSSSDKCALFSTFGISSDSENSQLGAKLNFNNVGGFYACGDGQDVWYKVSPEDGPSDCSSIDLWTVPVV